MATSSATSNKNQQPATTGSHLHLPDDEELALPPVTWIAAVDAGRLTLWQVA
jgi:hypothetical protein